MAWHDSRPYGMWPYEEGWADLPWCEHPHADTSRRFDTGAPLVDLAVPDTPAPRVPASKPQGTRATELAPLCLQLITTDGQPLAGVELTIRGADFERVVTTDADGMADLGDVAEGIYVAEPAAPMTLPKAPAAPMQSRGGIYSRRLPRDSTGFEVGTGDPRQILVVRPGFTEVLVDGYAQGAKVLRWGGMRTRADGTVGTARAALRAGLWLGRGRVMCVAGHADPLGQDADNEALSLARAQSLQLYAQGLLDDWASHAHAHATETDFACAMVACARILGTGPVSIDDDEAIDATHAAVRRHASLADEAPVGPGDWRAIADLYELDLAALLLTDLAGLAELRSTITWTDPAVVALGERHPRPDEEIVDAADLVAPAHRRTCLCVFGPQDTPQLAVDSGGDELYDGTYTRVSLLAPTEVLVDIAVDTDARDPLARGRAWIVVGNLGTHEHVAGADGHIRFMTFAGDVIEVVAAFDSKGRGTMTTVGMKE